MNNGIDHVHRELVPSPQKKKSRKALLMLILMRLTIDERFSAMRVLCQSHTLNVLMWRQHYIFLYFCFCLAPKWSLFMDPEC